MENEAATKQVSMEARTVDSVKGLLRPQDGDTTSLPSPPYSVEATEPDNDRNQDGSTGINNAATVMGVEANCQTS